MKKCPYCFEVLKEGSQKCPFCDQFIIDDLICVDYKSLEKRNVFFAEKEFLKNHVFVNIVING